MKINLLQKFLKIKKIKRGKKMRIHFKKNEEELIYPTKNYLQATTLESFKDVLGSLIDCDYCLQNYSEEGDKTAIEIYTNHLESAIDVWKGLNEKEAAQAELLLKIMERNNVDFIQFN